MTKDLDPEATVQQIGTLFAVETKKVKRYSIPFKAKESGTFNIALHAMSPVRADWLYLYRLTVREAENVNLAAKELTGSVNPVQGEESVYTVKVANEGADDVKGFSVKLKDQDGAELATKTFAETTIKSGEDIDVQIEWKPATTTTTAIKAEVAPTGVADEWAEDDTTDALMIGVRPPFTGKTVSVELDAKLNTVTTPFAFAWQYAAAQNIYTANEIGVADDQSIVKVAWPYDAMEVKDEDVKDVPVRVYMANTDRTNNTDGWIAESDYTLVYDGTVTLLSRQLLSWPSRFLSRSHIRRVRTSLCSPSSTPRSIAVSSLRLMSAKTEAMLLMSGTPMKPRVGSTSHRAAISTI